jgi:hypothetical protein
MPPKLIRVCQRTYEGLHEPDAWTEDTVKKLTVELVPLRALSR